MLRIIEVSHPTTLKKDLRPGLFLYLFQENSYALFGHGFFYISLFPSFEPNLGKSFWDLQRARGKTWPTIVIRLYVYVIGLGKRGVYASISGFFSGLSCYFAANASSIDIYIQSILNNQYLRISWYSQKTIFFWWDCWVVFLEFLKNKVAPIFLSHLWLVS